MAHDLDRPDLLEEHECNAWCRGETEHAAPLCFPPHLAGARAMARINAVLVRQASPWRVVAVHPAHESTLRLYPGVQVISDELEHDWIATGAEVPYLTIFRRGDP